MVDPSDAVEGARMNSYLYDAYANPGSSSTEPRISSTPPHLRYVLRCPTRREYWACMTPPQMDGTLHPLSQRLPRHRSPVGHPCGVSRPAPERSTLLTLHHDGARSDAITLSQEEVDNSTAQTTGMTASNTSTRATPKYDERATPPVLPSPPSGTTVGSRPRKCHP
ncbi:hypothetical protein BJV78DRAFT_955252 [Lactifluus subvellereus]|nr:hypothetical protein BJV78DRAFT_955252 [Lactifluus subvellereus]